MSGETIAAKAASATVPQYETEPIISPTKTESAPAPVPATAPEPAARLSKTDEVPPPAPGQAPKAPIAQPTSQETHVAPTTTAATTTVTSAVATSSSETPAAPNAQTGPIDPAIADLVAMFPDFDHSILRSVLESVGFNQDRAIDVLLNMNDPSYQPQAGPNDAQLTQTELDEQFARTLYLEESQAEAAAQAARGRGGWQPHLGQGQPLPYQPRQGNAGGQELRPQFGQPPAPGRYGPPASQESQGSGGDINFQEQFNKIAETGKKTFGTFFSKVKEKIKELDSPAPRHDDEPSQYQPPAAYYPQQHQQQQQQQQDRPHPSSREIPPMPTMTPTPAPPAPSLTAVPSMTPRTSADLSRAGIVPKRPVSLVEVKQAPRPTDDDDDELEYVENPFEERRH